MALRGIAAVALIGLLAACASEQSAPTQEKSRVEVAYERFQAYLDQCSTIHDTDPRTATVGENELAVREREWRSCAYDGVRTFLMPASTSPEDYAQMIAEDQAMTEKIAQGEMTRTERRARLDTMREEIAAKEERASEALASGQAARNAALIRQIRGLP